MLWCIRKYRSQTNILSGSNFSRKLDIYTHIYIFTRYPLPFLVINNHISSGNANAMTVTNSMCILFIEKSGTQQIMFYYNIIL